MALAALAAILASAPAVAVEPAAIAVRGLARPAEVLVDRWGVPHIYASNEDDLFLAQGFVAARDRLFQIDLWRRRGLGRLAEVLGPEFVEQDRAARLFLYRGDMEREWRAYSPGGGLEARRIATRFVAGVNAWVDWLAAHPERLPWEFRRMGYRPERWSPEDVVRIRSHGLTRNVASEVARAAVACRAGLEWDRFRVRLEPAVTPALPEGLDPCLPKDVLRVFELATRGVTLPGTEETRVAAGDGDSPSDWPEGSNNWVVSPARSATGRPILANDPHRAYSAPSLRYIAHLSAPGLDVIGAGEPALPGISIGHNGTIAFGLTIFAIDQEDLYVYDLAPGDARRYRYRGGLERMRVVRETIAVKGRPPVPVELVFTRHGPVIFTDTEKQRAYAVRTCWLEAGTSPYFGSVGYMRAKDPESFRAALRKWGAPTENQVYADTQGNIGWIAAGLAPIRPNWDGLLPVPGNGRYEWAGFRRGEELPQSWNPAEGFLATANEMNLPVDYPPERRLGFEWSHPARRERIGEVLGGAGKISIEDSRRLQGDRLSIPARRLQAVLREATLGQGAARPRDLLLAWDAVLAAESPAAALFELWLSRHLGRRLKDSLLAGPAGEAVSRLDLAVVLEAMETPDRWFTRAPREERDRVLTESLEAAWADGEKRLGGDPSLWQWGRLHHNLAAHPFSAAADASTRARIDVGPLPRGGSGQTVNASSYRATDFLQTSGPSFRMILDVGRWDASLAVNHPGQSGDPDGPHYRDLADAWSRGEYFPLLYSRPAIEAVTESRLRLVPRD